MEKTFQEIINTIKEGEVWINKCKDRRLAKIEKHYETVIFELSDNHKDVGIRLNDIFVLDKKKYTFEEAMKALKKGDIIESCYSSTKYNERVECSIFSLKEIFGDWYINN